MLPITQKLRQLDSEGWSASQVILPWLFSTPYYGKEQEGEREAFDALQVALHPLLFDGVLVQEIYGLLFTPTSLREALNEEWEGVLLGTPNTSVLRHLRLDCEVGVACLRCILQADYMIEQFPDEARRCQSLNLLEFDATLMRAAVRQCAVYHYG